MLIYFSDVCQTNYLGIYRTVLREICWVGRTLAVGERSEVIFFDLLKDVVTTANFLFT